MRYKSARERRHWERMAASPDAFYRGSLAAVIKVDVMALLLCGVLALLAGVVLHPNPLVICLLIAAFVAVVALWSRMAYVSRSAADRLYPMVRRAVERGRDDGPPPDSTGVREPRRPRPNGPSNSIRF